MMVGDPHFDFASPGRIVFGWEALSRLPEYIAHLGPRPLVVSGGSIARVDPV